jgi:endoglucanase
MNPLALTLPLIAACATVGPRHPFGSHPQRYTQGAIRPSVAAAELDRTVASFYDRWRARYLRADCGGMVVLTGGGTGAPGAITVSEGHGYGMLITALMAGHDPQARPLFDGLAAVFKRFPSNIDPALMAWGINPGCVAVTDGDSATDGDLDIAYAFLLADRQWGSAGPIRYDDEALKIIAAIKKSEMDPRTHLPLLGDWHRGEAEYEGATRPSDFMPEHFRAFARATGDPFWSASVDAVYQLVTDLQGRHAPRTGLVPDFVVDSHRLPAPAPTPFLDEPRPSDYHSNSCRVPWRLGTDHLVTGEPRARAALARINTWVRAATGGDPARIAGGYRLDGTSLDRRPDDCFRAPLAVAAMSDPANQPWLDALWKALAAGPLDSYYGDTVKMLSLLVISGNWWSP